MRLLHFAQTECSYETRTLVRLLLRCRGSDHEAHEAHEELL